MVNTLERAFVKWISISFIVLALIVALPAFSADVFVDDGHHVPAQAVSYPGRGERQ